jgi:hypothetical protein
MTWDDVSDKFASQSAGIVPTAHAREIVERTAAIEHEASLRHWAELLGCSR